MSISRPAIVLIMIGLFLFFAATNVQSGWLYVMDALIWSLLFFSVALPFWQMRRLEITRHHPSIVYEEEPFEISLKIENNGRRTLAFLEFEDLIGK